MILWNQPYKINAAPTMEEFFYCVTLPEAILSGRMNCESAVKALQYLELAHPTAVELHIRKQKLNARNQTICKRDRNYQQIG
jgi:hypothetical protein